MHGFHRIAAAVPLTRVADTAFNAERILGQMREADARSAALVVFPELCVTSYSCADLFFQTSLLDAAENAAAQIAKESRSLQTVSVIGAPVRHLNALYNCALVIHKGSILGIIPKTHIPNYREFYERRWFTPCPDAALHATVDFAGRAIPFAKNLIFIGDDHFRLAVEICEDLWSVAPPSGNHALAGATIIANLSASDELVSKSDYRRDLVRHQSARCVCAYAYASSGPGESSSDLVYGGHSLISENGALLAEGERFSFTDTLTYADVDCQRMLAIRMAESGMGKEQDAATAAASYRLIELKGTSKLVSIERDFPPHPFVPSDEHLRDTRCEEIFMIQSTGLARRLAHTKAVTSIIGVSGGLDSTLALLVARGAHAILGKKDSDVVAVTMPGFGTSSRTYENTKALCEELGCDLREVDIKDACAAQFALIDHDAATHDTTFENVQARQRTMILMNLANKERGLVIGTGDLSEMALGWSTFNGDHMSMYAVNCGVPKTLVRYMVRWAADHSSAKLKEILSDIADTPVSPELVPPDASGRISQKTEELIGPYELHDFFLYHTIKYGASPEKTELLAKLAFKGAYTGKQIRKYARIFFTRFFSQQYKRNCVPDGPKVGTIALSPRGDWRMPSDASDAAWSDTSR